MVRRRNGETESEVWLPILTASAVLPAQLLSCLPESPGIAARCTGRQGLFGEFCEQLAAYVPEMDCAYSVNWDAWLPRIRDCFLVGVHKPGDDDGEMDKPESDSEDEVQQVRGVGGGTGPRLPPRRSDRRRRTMGIVRRRFPPKKLTRPAKDSAPQHFPCQSGASQGQEPNPLENVVCFAP